MSAYYNEFDPYAAAWLRNLISAGHIAPGVVDERSIEDVRPADLAGFTQCHFFAGIGVWSLALRRAGWSDDRPIWTGSCPCQPFSKAGQGAGFSDERHLWPAFHWLIQERQPAIVLGEQVASSDAEPWLDLVQADVESLGYAFGAIAFPSAGVGAPHIRDRLYWIAKQGGASPRRRAAEAAARYFHGLADADCVPGRKWRAHLRGRAVGGDAQSRAGSGGGGVLDGGANSHGSRFGAMPIAGIHDVQHHAEPCGRAGLLGDPEREGLALSQRIGRIFSGASGADAGQALERAGLHPAAGPGPTNGLWAAADWLACRDGKWRPVEPGTFPLASRPSDDVVRVRSHWSTPAGKEDQGHRGGRLKGYGNAINAEAARIFIESVMDESPV